MRKCSSMRQVQWKWKMWRRSEKSEAIESMQIVCNCQMSDNSRHSSSRRMKKLWQRWVCECCKVPFTFSSSATSLRHSLLFSKLDVTVWERVFWQNSGRQFSISIGDFSSCERDFKSFSIFLQHFVLHRGKVVVSENAINFHYHLNKCTNDVLVVVIVIVVVVLKCKSEQRLRKSHKSIFHV